MEFQTIPSKLNDHSLEELEMHDADPFNVVINKLLHIAINPTKSQRNAIQSIATKLSNMDAIGSSNKVKGRYVVYSQSRNQWIAFRTVNGKKHQIKSGKDKATVIKAYNEFCIKHNLKP